MKCSIAYKMLSQSTDIKVNANHRIQIYFFIAYVYIKFTKHFRTTLDFCKFWREKKNLSFLCSSRKAWDSFLNIFKIITACFDSDIF